MKVVLLILSGDQALAQKTLAANYPQAELQLVSRSQLGEGGLASRLRALRSLQPDIFAIATERLSWQRGQNLFMLFGALAGAREVVMLDAHGGEVRKSRASLLFSTPVKLSGDAILSARTFARARRELMKLEDQVGKASALEVRKIKNPRVVFLRSTPGPGTQAGGAASHIKGVVEGLLELGANVEVVSNDWIAGFDDTRAPLSVIKPVSSGSTRAIFDINNNLSFTRSLLPLLESNPPDFIYQRYARFSWAGVVAALKIRRPLFLEYNGSEVWVGRHWDRVGQLDLLERYEHLNLQAAARIFVVSEIEKRNLENRGVSPGKIVINPNGVDTNLFRPNVGGDAVREALGFTAGDVVVGFVGTFGPWHGVMVLAEAIRAIAPDVPVKFLLVGAGSLHGEVQQMLQGDPRVVFTGPVKHEKVPGFLDACDILASPHVPLQDGSDFFGSPTKLFEYMAMGKAIVASRLGQIGDVLEDEETAILVEPGNASELANAIRRLATSKELRSRLGEKVREAAVMTHTWKHNAQRILDEYASLC